MSSWRGQESPAGEKRSWKGKTKGTARSAASGKFWASGSGATKPMISGNLIRLFIAMVALLASTLGMVVYLFNNHRPTPIVSLIALDYLSPWAPNAWAQEDQLSLARLAEGSTFAVSGKEQNEEQGTWQELLKLELDEMQPGLAGSLVPALWGYRTLVVHLSAHGVLNGKGEPCLLFTQADPLDEATWTPLEEVLEFIGQHEKVVANAVRVLVVLDSGKQPPDMRCGLFTAGFAAAAKAKIQSMPLKQFAVLLSCAEGQNAWTAPEMAGSVFGVMLVSGLRGPADALAGDGNGWISVQELAKFVAATVDGYVREHRGRVQNPALVWCGENQAADFDVGYRSDYTFSPAGGYQANSRIQQMSAAWERFQTWSDGATSQAAWQRARAAARLARAEQLLWAGAGYADQFDLELDAAAKLTLSDAFVRWPGSICGGSLAFLNRIHGIDRAAELQAAGWDPQASLPTPATLGTGTPSMGTPSSGTTGANATTAGDATGAATATAAASGGQPASPTSAAIDGASAPAATAAAASAAEFAPGQQLVQWLTFTATPTQAAAPPPRPELPDRAVAVEFLTRWLSQHPQQLQLVVMDRIIEWLGPITDSRSVTREEALLRTIGDHLRLTSSWNLPSQSQLGPLWGQYLQTASLCEAAMAPIDARISWTLERETAELSLNLQLVRDQIHGCESERNVSNCANELRALRASAETALQVRERLERSWRMRDEVARELPVLAQWISSPLGRLQPSLTMRQAWDLCSQLCQQMKTLQEILAAGQIPETAELDSINQALNKLVSAYADAQYKIIDLNAKGQRKPLGDLMLSLGLRPNFSPGTPSNNRGNLHQGLDRRYRDFQNVYSAEKLKAYCESPTTDGVDSEVPWRMSDLPSSVRDALPAIAFTESITARPVVATDLTHTDEPARWSAIGSELRETWRNLPQHLAAISQACLDEMQAADQALIVNATGRLQACEFQAQLLAQLVPSAALNVLPEPPQQHWSVSSQQFALWQVRRSLTDFWKTPVVSTTAQGSFLSTSASDWLAAIPLPAQGPTQLCESQLAAAQRLAQSWPEVWSPLASDPASSDVWEAELKLAAYPGGSSWLRLAVDGQSSQAVPQENGRYQTSMSTGLATQAAQRFSLPTSQLPEGNHEMLAWFRGHTARTLLPIYQRQPPVILAWQAEDPGQTTIRVHAEPKPARIVFVLDCSNSLGAKNMQIAKDTLLEVIRGISKATAGQTEIAVIVFGHTSQYGTVTADLHSNWPGPKNHPYDDVEILQDLAIPTPKVLADLERSMNRLQHFGQTPFYESLLRAIKLLDQNNVGFGGDLRVVAITDGKDHPFAYSAGLAANGTAKGNFQVPSQFIHTEQEPIRMAEGRISLDFVAFVQQAGLDKLNAMASATGGKVYQATQDNLAERLLDSIARDTFTTQNLTTKRTLGTRRRLSLEETIKADQLPGQFEVRIDDTAARQSLALLGGETIELQYGRQSGLSFLPYREGDDLPQRGEFDFGGEPYSAIMLTGIPRAIPQIRICLQANNRSIQSQRPPQFMLEVQRTQPGQAATGERIAWTSDALWENHHNSPVMRVVIKNLPELQDSRLECRLWVANPNRSAPVEIIPLTRLREQPAEVVPGVMASAQVDREAGRLKVTLTEQRQDPAAPLVHWQVRPAADQVVEHQVHNEQVSHLYYFSDPTIISQVQVVASPLPPTPDADWQATQWIPVPEWK